MLEPKSFSPSLFTENRIRTLGVVLALGCPHCLQGSSPPRSQRQRLLLQAWMKMWPAHWGGLCTLKTVGAAGTGEVGSGVHNTVRGAF